MDITQEEHNLWAKYKPLQDCALHDLRFLKDVLHCSRRCIPLTSFSEDLFFGLNTPILLVQATAFAAWMPTNCIKSFTDLMFLQTLIYSYNVPARTRCEA